MTDYVRVREGGWEYSVEKRLLPEGLEVLDKSPYAPSGKVAPPKPVTPLGTPAPGSKQERRRTTKKSEAARQGTDAGQSSAKTKE